MPGRRCPPVAKNLAQQVHDTITAHPDGLTLEQIAAEVGESRTKVSSCLYNLVHRHPGGERVVQHPANVPRGKAMFYPQGHGPGAEGLGAQTSVTPSGAGAPAASAAAEVQKTPLLGDREKFEQVLENLGVKAGPTRTITETFI